MPPTPNPPRGQFDFSAGEVETALKSFPIGSSAGLSGLRPCHSLEMCRSDERSRLLETLASFCSALANNSFSSDCMKLLTTARLVAVFKQRRRSTSYRRRRDPQALGCEACARSHPSCGVELLAADACWREGLQCR